MELSLTGYRSTDDDVSEVCPHCYGDHDGCTPSTPLCSAGKLANMTLTDRVPYDSSHGDRIP